LVIQERKDKEAAQRAEEAEPLNGHGGDRKGDNQDYNVMLKRGNNAALPLFWRQAVDVERTGRLC
jgi:hypothetical protein